MNDQPLAVMDLIKRLEQENDDLRRERVRLRFSMRCAIAQLESPPPERCSRAEIAALLRSAL